MPRGRPSPPYKIPINREKFERIMAPFRNPMDPSFLQSHCKKTRVNGYESALKSGKLPRFHSLPPDQRDHAEKVFQSLCSRWAERIRQTPRFKNILYMNTINLLKNPGQQSKAVNVRLKNWNSRRTYRAIINGNSLHYTLSRTPEPKPVKSPKDIRTIHLVT